MSLLELLGASLLLLGSSLVIYAVWSADERDASAAEALPPAREEQPSLRRAA